MLLPMGWGLIPCFRPIEPKDLKSHKSCILIPFLQTRPDFKQNFKMNPKKSLEVKISLHLGIWALKARFRTIGPKTFGKNLYKP